MPLSPVSKIVDWKKNFVNLLKPSAERFKIATKFRNLLQVFCTRLFMHKAQELVSIIIPVYNHESYVEETLNSVYYQTYPDLEVIIIDDGSKDHSVQKIEAWLLKHQEIAEQRNTQFVRQENQGAHITINRGLHLAKGHYLTILNSDDYFHLRRIEILVSRLENEKREFAFSRIFTIDQHGKPIPRGHWWLNWYEKALVQTIDPTTGFRFLRHNIAISTGNFFFTKRLFQEVGDFKDLKLSHDYDFIMRTIAICEPLFVDEELYFYRIHAENTTNKVQHLGQIELDEIHRQYFQLTSTPPKNPLAPCHHYWPMSFACHRKQLSLDRGLTTVFEKVEEISEEAPLTSRSFQNLGTPITLISHELSLSGGPKVLVDLAQSLQKNGYAPRVIALNDGPLRNDLKKLNIPVSVIPNYLRFWEKGCSFFTRFLKLLGAQLFVLIKSKGAFFSNTISAWPLAITTCFTFFWKKYFWYIHESCGPEALIPGGFGRTLFRKALKKENLKFLFGSKATKNLWESYGISGKTFYWSGIDAGKSPKKRERIQNILSVGSGEARKGFHTLIEAFIRLIKEKRISESVNLILVGFSKSLNQMHNFNSDLILKISSEGIQDRVKLFPSVSKKQLEELYEKADLYVQPSQMECMPLSLLEAMARGIPVIGSSVDGLPEAIEQKVNGWLFPARNIQLLALSLEEAIKNPEKCYCFAEKAQKKFNEKFALEKTEKELINYLKQYAF